MSVKRDFMAQTAPLDLLTQQITQFEENLESEMMVSEVQGNDYVKILNLNRASIVNQLHTKLYTKKRKILLGVSSYLF